MTVTLTLTREEERQLRRMRDHGHDCGVYGLLLSAGVSVDGRRDATYSVPVGSVQDRLGDYELMRHPFGPFVGPLTDKLHAFFLAAGGVR